MLTLRHGRVLTGVTLDTGDLVIDGGTIAEVGCAPRDSGFSSATVDAAGLLVLPGIVDIHGDAFERQIMPRPGVTFPLDLAFLETDRQLIANGITTAYHGVTWSWEPGLRGTDSVVAIVDTLERLRPRLRADTRVHLRQEVYNLEAEPAIAAWVASGRLGCLAFNDHMSGTIKVRHRPDKLAKMVERSGLDPEAFGALIERVIARAEDVPASIARLAAVAVAHGIPLLSHDDLSPAERRARRTIGATIAEFPVTEATAEEAARGGDPIVFGAPNVIRGGSHTGCPDAAAMVEAGLCTALASDYYYPALAAAPFRLAADARTDFATAWNLVSLGPATALGLADRGRLAPGMRADVVLVDASDTLRPRVVATVIGGRIVHLAEPDRLAGSAAARAAATACAGTGVTQPSRQ